MMTDVEMFLFGCAMRSQL